MSRVVSKTEISSCSSSFGPCFLNWEITGPYKFLLNINWYIGFLKMLHWINCSKNKNIGNIWPDATSFINMKYKNWLQKLVFAGAPLVPVFFFNWEITGPYKFLLKIIWKIAFLKMLHWIICFKNKNIWNTCKR